MNESIVIYTGAKIIRKLCSTLKWKIVGVFRMIYVVLHK